MEATHRHSYTMITTSAMEITCTLQYCWAVEGGLPQLANKEQTYINSNHMIWCANKKAQRTRSRSCAFAAPGKSGLCTVGVQDQFTCIVNKCSRFDWMSLKCFTFFHLACGAWMAAVCGLFRCLPLSLLCCTFNGDIYKLNVVAVYMTHSTQC